MQGIIDSVETLWNNSTYKEHKIGVKTCVVCLTLPCGFEISSTSSCVEASEYDHDEQVSLCLHSLRDKLRMLEGYVAARLLSESIINIEVDGMTYLESEKRWVSRPRKATEGEIIDVRVSHKHPEFELGTVLHQGGKCYVYQQNDETCYSRWVESQVDHKSSDHKVGFTPGPAPRYKPRPDVTRVDKTPQYMLGDKAHENGKEYIYAKHYESGGYAWQVFMGGVATDNDLSLLRGADLTQVDVTPQHKIGEVCVQDGIIHFYGQRSGGYGWEVQDEEDTGRAKMAFIPDLSAE